MTRHEITWAELQGDHVIAAPIRRGRRPQHSRVRIIAPQPPTFAAQSEESDYLRRPGAVAFVVGVFWLLVIGPAVVLTVRAFGGWL